MTTLARALLGTPRIEAQTFAVGHTAQGSHGFALADLANDAATGHPSQRVTVGRTNGGTFHGWLTPSNVVRFARITVNVAWRAGATWVAGDGVRVAMTVTDGTTTASTAPAIPAELGASGETFTPAYPASVRTSSITAHSVIVDLSELGAVLDVTQLWRVTFAVTCDTTATCEGVALEELPRFIVDDATDAGVIPTHFQPRAVIDAGAQSFARVNTSTRWAYYHTPRVFHCGSPGEADPYVCTSGSYAPLGQDADDGAARVWTVRPYVARGASSTGCRVLWTVRYRITGASAGDKGYVRLTTGAGTYTLTLTDVSGSWADATPTGGYLSTSVPKDALSFTARRDAGTLELSARQVWSDPE